MYVLSLKTDHVAVTHKPAFSSWAVCKPTNKFFILSGLCFFVCDVYVCVRAQEGHLTDHSRVSEDKCCWWSAVAGSASGEDVHCSTRYTQTIFTLIGSLTKPVSLWENCKSFISKAVAKGQIPTVCFWLWQERISMGERACYRLDKPESCPHTLAGKCLTNVFFISSSPRCCAAVLFLQAQWHGGKENSSPGEGIRNTLGQGLLFFCMCTHGVLSLAHGAQVLTVTKSVQ